MTETIHPGVAGTGGPKPGFKRLSPDEKTEIRRLVGEGEARVSECAKRFGVTPSSISQLLAHDDISFGSIRRAREEAEREAAKKAAAEAAAKVAATWADQKARRIEETRNQGYKYQDDTDKLLMSLIGQAVKTATTAGASVERAVAGVNGAAKSLLTAKRAFALSTQTRLALLEVEKMVDADELPELPIRDLTDEEIAKIRNSNGDDDFLAEADAEIPSLEEGEITLEEPS